MVSNEIHPVNICVDLLLCCCCCCCCCIRPDWGCPANCDAFLRLVDAVDEHNSSGGPIVVHCSAGIGRTGTFCTVHAAVEKFRAERAGSVPGPEGAASAVLRPASRHANAVEASPLDAASVSRDGTPPGHLSVLRIVEHLRRARPGMVQTRDQYTFAYTAILTALQRENSDSGRASTLRGRIKVICCRFCFCHINGSFQAMPPVGVGASFVDHWRGDEALYFDTSKSHCMKAFIVIVSIFVIIAYCSVCLIARAMAWARVAGTHMILPSKSAHPTPMISQGSLGDAWFLGAVATVATTPHVLEQRVRMSYDASVGQFSCRFYKDGAWRAVLVDDRLPCFSEVCSFYLINSNYNIDDGRACYVCNSCLLYTSPSPRD